MAIEIDWETQWACHAKNFSDGCAHIPLPNKREIKLLSGPGFGDYSHSTTRASLSLIASEIQNRPFFDIGCGSGILALGAILLGATKSYITDIDPNAIAHAKKNAQRNGIEKRVHACSPPAGSRDLIIAMNMISSEQSLAWKKHKRPFTRLITSGVLATERSAYLYFAQTQHWKPLVEIEEEDWLAFIFEEIR